VSVRWLPWRWRRRLEGGDVLGAAIYGAEGPLSLLVMFVLALALAALLPVLWLVFELALVLSVALPLVTVLGIIGITRWSIEVEREAVRLVMARHRGVRAAEQSMASIATAIERGTLDPSSGSDGAPRACR
jgi:hypothetical protein